jgi:large subunit ribosomal protein L6
MKLDEFKTTVAIPSGVTVSYATGVFTVKGKAGTVIRNLSSPKIKIAVAGQSVDLSSKKATKREKTLINTFAAHIANAIRGVQQPFIYELKICSGHFPMTATLKGTEFELKNFLGESYSRKMSVPKDAKVVISGDKITVESADVELAGKVASQLELVTRITNRDRRVFQDGIYIIKKDGAPI